MKGVDGRTKSGHDGFLRIGFVSGD